MSRWPATTAVACGIWALSATPPTALPHPPLFPHADKVAHVIEYLVLGALLFRSLDDEFSGNPRLMAIIAVAFGTAFGALDEWHQRFTDRTPDVWDLVADVVGLACGAALVRLARQWRRKHGG